MSARPGISKYFIAIVPPSPAYEEALKWKEFFRDRYATRAALRSPPHITLHMPFEWKPSKENNLVDSLTKFARGCEAFEIRLCGFGCFPPRVIFINAVLSPALQNLQSQLVQFCKSELNLFNANRQDQPYHPHLTVAFRDLNRSLFSKAWLEVERLQFDHAFIGKSISLLKHNGKIWEVENSFTFD